MRQTKAALLQRQKDEKARSQVTYKVKSVLGVAQRLKSDTADEIESRRKRREKIATALGINEYDHKEGPPAWCTYNAVVKILKGDFKGYNGNIVSVKNLVESGNILVFIPEANKSIKIPLNYVRVVSEDETEGFPFESVNKMTAKIKNASQVLNAVFLNNIEKQKQKILLLRHMSEFKYLKDYAWIEEFDETTQTTRYWNAVSNERTSKYPQGLRALQEMESSGQEEMNQNIEVARVKLLNILAQPSQDTHHLNLAPQHEN